MDNGRITGGAVSYMRRVNKGNYEHEEASAKIDFIAHDGMDASPVLAAAETEAKASVMAQLGLASRPLVPATAPVVQNAAAKEPEVKKVVAHRKSKEIEALDAAGPSADPLAPAADASAPATPPASPAASVASAGGDDPLAPAATVGLAEVKTATMDASISTAGTDDPLAPAGASDMTASTASTDEFTAQREVTDADLATAAAKNNERLVKLHKEAGTVKIRDLIGKFLAPGKPLRELPQADRAKFLQQLEALT